MKKQLLKLGVLTLILFGMGITSHAQIRKEKKANQEFESFAFVDAIKVYEKIVENGKANSSVLEKLGDSYYFTGKFVEANKWYSELFEGEYKGKDVNKIPSEYYYRYAQTLKAVGKIQESDKMLERFANIEQTDSRARLFQATKDTYLQDLDKIPQRYEVQSLAINSGFSDYGGTLLGNKLIFTSSRETEDKGNKVHEWTNEHYTSLYETTIGQEGSFTEPKLFSKEVDGKFVNDATAVFTADGQTMYFTRNNASTKGNKKYNEKDNSLLKIYKATKQADEQWGQVLELPFNSDDFNTAHPALTPDGNWMYFASDRKGTIGQSDIFRVAIYDDGKFGDVENLGANINTEGRESFPYISKDNILYFSSDGRPGYGGLDVYQVKINVDGTLGTVVNMGAPINSAFDDFAFYLDVNSRKGFISSNRGGGHGADDIYFIKERDCYQTIEGRVFDLDSQRGLADSKLTLYSNLYKNLKEVQTDANGNYRLSEIGCEAKYRLKVELPNYNTEELAFELGYSLDNVKKIDVGLDKSDVVVSVNDDLFRKMRLKPIYFDFNKSDIRLDATFELMQVVEVMKQYPELRVDVRSHTDSRGKSAYNLALSQRRVKATINWMVKQGIAPGRLTGRGFGDKQLINGCNKGVHCSDQEHELNRRSEFIIKEL